MTDIMRQDQQSTEVMQRPTAASMVQAIISSGITAENAAAMKDVVELYKVMEAMESKKTFAQAFSALQDELPSINATRAIPKKDGTIRSTFAPIEEIQQKLKPYLSKHGFYVSFDTEPSDKGVCAICILSHTSGHSESRRFSVRTSAPPETSAGQADAATLTIAKRYALCNMFNIAVTHDDDARLEGDYISEEQAAALERRARALPSSGRDRVADFLKAARAIEFKKIRSGMYAQMEDALTRAEKKQNGGGPSAKTGDVHAASSPAASSANAEPIPSQTKGGDTGQPPKSPSLPLAGTAAPRNVSASFVCKSCGSEGMSVVKDGGKACLICGAPDNKTTVDPPATIEEQREPPENAAQDWANQDVRFLTNWLMKLDAGERAKAMVAAGVRTLVDAQDKSISDVAYHAFLAQLAKDKK